MMGHGQVMTRLFEAGGVDVDRRDRDGNTPLHW
jgi:ankyrin repeat protein